MSNIIVKFVAIELKYVIAIPWWLQLFVGFLLESEGPPKSETVDIRQKRREFYATGVLTSSVLLIDKRDNKWQSEGAS
jgi:hypothetical protein